MERVVRIASDWAMWIQPNPKSINLVRRLIGFREAAFKAPENYKIKILQKDVDDKLSQSVVRRVTTMKLQKYLKIFGLTRIDWIFISNSFKTLALKSSFVH